MTVRRFFSDDFKFKRRLIAILFEGALVLVALFVFCSLTLGWFAQNHQITANGMQVKADGFVFPELHAWRYDMTATVGTGEGNVDENGDTLDKTGAWVDAIDYDTTTTPKGLLPTEEYTGNAHEEHLSFRSLHMGTVDNLLDYSSDNLFYLRFDVTGDVCYPSAIAYSLYSAGVTVYDQEGNDVTSVLSAMGELDDFVSVFTVEAAVSTSAYVPETDQDDIDALFDSSSVLTNGAALTALADGSEDYYLYVRFAPDLEMCFEATDGIAQYMPCEITFDVTVTVSFS